MISDTDTSRNLALKINDNQNVQSSLQLAEDIASACSEAKAKDITVLNMEAVTYIADYFIIVSGKSDRQVQGIANKVIDLLQERGVKPHYIEGLEEGHWVILDFGDIILHVFYEETRKFYDIENLWTKAKKINL